MAKRKKKKYLLTFLTSAGEKTFISKSLSTEDLEAAIQLKKHCKDRVFLLNRQTFSVCRQNKRRCEHLYKKRRYRRYFFNLNKCLHNSNSNAKKQRWDDRNLYQQRNLCEKLLFRYVLPLMC